LLKEIERRWQVGEEGTPGAEFGFASALDDDGVVVSGEEGEKGECCLEKGGSGGGWGWWKVDCVVENVVEEKFEGVREVRKRCVVGRDRGGRGNVGGCKIVLQDRWEKKSGLDDCVSVWRSGCRS